MGEAMSGRPLLIVVSAPSGAGKTTLCDRLLAEFKDLAYSVSCTTRPPRGRERDGIDYVFLDEAEFERRVRAGAFLEHAAVHGYRYGTLKQAVREPLAAGRSVLMDLDVQGAALVRRQVREAPEDAVLRASFVDVFIKPPSIAVLRRRLVDRGEDSPDVIERRIANARHEMAHSHAFRHCIVNRELESAYRRLRTIVLSESKRVAAPAG